MHQLKVCFILFLFPIIGYSQFYNPSDTNFVSLKSVEYEVNSWGVSIHWWSSKETHVNEYTLERSIDLKNWEAVFNHEAAGESDRQVAYRGADNVPFEGITYYRFKSIFYDGSSFYFEPFAVKAYGQEVDAIVFPTLSNDILRISFSSEEEPVSLYDVYGRSISANTITQEYDKAQKVLAIDISKLVSGKYSLNIGNEFKSFLKY